ncbi:hypothetical protein [Streptomyces hydrogenans]|uniref:hypothetical protein n=1 Tax=Streptomyces hydrogenans TaxID=1873719 RepID=UPI003813A17F
MRAHADAFIAYATDPDPRVRRASIEGLGLFLEDAERAVGLLQERLVHESGVAERVLVVQTMADLVLRLPAAAAPARAWFDALADSGSTDADTRLAALAHRARCAPDSIDDRTVPVVIELLRRVTPAPPPEQDPAPDDRRPSRCVHVRPRRRAIRLFPGTSPQHSTTSNATAGSMPPTPLLKALHEALGARFDDRKALLTEQLRSADRATRYDAIDMARRLIASWRGDHTDLAVHSPM